MGRSPIAFHPCPSFSPAPEGGSPGRRSAASRPPASPRRGGQAGLALGMLRILCAQPLPAARLVVLARAGRRGAPGFALAPLAAAASPLLPQPGPGAAAAAAESGAGAGARWVNRDPREGARRERERAAAGCQESEQPWQRAGFAAGSWGGGDGSWAGRWAQAAGKRPIGTSWGLLGGAGLRDLPDSPNSCAQSHAEKEEKMEPPAPSRAASPTCPPAADGPVSPRATEMRLGQVLWSHP
ncbi:unnamed protein product [Caretta caretta]